MSLEKVIRNIVRESLIENEFNQTGTLTLFHGTKNKFVNLIKQNGLEDKSSVAYTQGWYVLSTDFESALFHAHPDDNKDFIYVFEFEVPIKENDHWLGYPYLWKGGKIKDNSTWFALMQKLPKEFIKKIHKVDYKDWIKQKNIGF